MRPSVFTMGLLLCAVLAFRPARADEPILRETLPSGATLILQERPGCGTFAIDLVALGGRAEDPAGRIGLTDLLARMLLRGTATRDGAMQAAEVERAGAAIGSTGGFLGITLRASGPAPALAAALEVVLDAAAHPRMSPDDLAGEIVLVRRRLQAGMDDITTLRDRALLPLLLGVHPLGRVAAEKGYLDGMDADALRLAHASRFTARRMILVVVGDLDAAAVRRTAEAALAALPAGSDPMPIDPPRPLAAPRRARVKKRTTQPEVVVAMPTAGVPPADQPAMDLLAHILAGTEERLGLEIRQKRGWAYWVAPVDWRYGTAGVFGVATAVPRGRLEEARGIILEQMRALAGQPPSEEEMERARRYRLATLARTWQQSSGRADAFAAAAARRQPPRSYEEWAAAYAAVTPAQVRDLAARLFTWSETATVTVR